MSVLFELIRLVEECVMIMDIREKSRQKMENSLSVENSEEDDDEMEDAGNFNENQATNGDLERKNNEDETKISEDEPVDNVA